MKTRGCLRLAVLAVVLGILATAAPARAAFVNFDNLPSPGSTPLVLSGVTFTPTHGGQVLISGSTLPDGFSTVPFTGKCYAFNFATDSNPTMLTITFDRPVFLVKFQFSGFNSFSSNNIFINALDINDNLLDSQQWSDAIGYRDALLCAKGIKSVVIKSSGTSVGTMFLDNFSFYPLAPSATIIPMN